MLVDVFSIAIGLFHVLSHFDLTIYIYSICWMLYDIKLSHRSLFQLVCDFVPFAWWIFLVLFEFNFLAKRKLLHSQPKAACAG